MHVYQKKLSLLQALEVVLEFHLFIHLQLHGLQFFIPKTPPQNGFPTFKKNWAKSCNSTNPTVQTGAQVATRRNFDSVSVLMWSSFLELAGRGFWMGSKGRMGFFFGDRETVLGPDWVRIHCWLDVKSCFFVEDLYFVWRGLPEKINFHNNCDFGGAGGW